MRKAEDISGARYGKLVVTKRAENLRGRTAWECKCDCGNTHIVTTKELKSGKCKSCGCLKHKKNRGMVDLTDKKFDRLTALFPTEERDGRGSIYWHCRCDCGNELDIPEDALVRGNYKSCGCFRKEIIWDDLRNKLHFVDGTCLEILEKRKNRVDNKSGFRGVYLQKNGKYKVGIGFKGKKYYIATVSTLEEAIEKRLEAEEVIHDGFVNAYHKWNDIHKNCPEGAKETFVYDIEKINGQFVVHTNI